VYKFRRSEIIWRIFSQVVVSLEAEFS